MVGNDLVDLRQAAWDSNWQRKGYLNKICMRSEEAMILKAHHPMAMLWLIWTMKEASYKVINRITGIRNYSPRSYLCSGLNFNGPDATASVTFGAYRLFIKAQFNEDMVHSTAVLKEKDLASLRLHFLSNSPAYMDNFNRSCPDYFLSKTSGGLPVITHLPSAQILEASISHHGRYAAIAYSAPDCSGSPQ